MEPPLTRYGRATAVTSPGDVPTVSGGVREEDSACAVPAPRVVYRPRRPSPKRDRVDVVARAERVVHSALPPSLHSSAGPRRDRFGQPDPFGMNDVAYRALVDKMKDDEIRQTLSDSLQQEAPPPPKPDLGALRAKWLAATKDIMCPAPSRLPPFREINHRIPLIDPDKRYNYYLPRCPDAMRPQLLEKIERYTAAGWWERKTAPQAPPLMCIMKKSGKLRTVIDARQRNDNTVKDVTPFPDQDLIRMDVARARFRSKIDLSDAYEQIRIAAEDIWKAAFATPYGTFVSHVMQQGDCNAPATFQSLMTVIFQEFLGRFVHVYLDDIFVFSDTIEEHEEHLRLVFAKRSCTSARPNVISFLSVWTVSAILLMTVVSTRTRTRWSVSAIGGRSAPTRKCNASWAW